MQARWGTHGDHAIIALTASNNQDVFTVTVEAFNMAERYRTPVILLLDEVVAHTRERITLPDPEEIEVVQRLKTSVPEGTDYHPYLPREDGRLPMSDFGGVHRYNVGLPVKQSKDRVRIDASSGRQDRGAHPRYHPDQSLLGR